MGSNLITGWIARIGVFLLVGFFGIQFIPVQRVNPAVESEAPMPSQLKSVVKRACYDCHSNETVWPWYSQIAPISWLIARDVRWGRNKLNYSDWGQYNERKKASKLRETVSEVEKGKMPPWFYVLIHPNAGLSKRDVELLRNWVKKD